MPARVRQGSDDRLATAAAADKAVHVFQWSGKLRAVIDKGLGTQNQNNTSDVPELPKIDAMEWLPVNGNIL